MAVAGSDKILEISNPVWERLSIKSTNRLENASHCDFIVISMLMILSCLLISIFAEHGQEKAWDHRQLWPNGGFLQTENHEICESEIIAQNQEESCVDVGYWMLVICWSEYLDALLDVIWWFCDLSAGLVWCEWWMFIGYWIDYLS